MINEWNRVFKRNKELDDIFLENYKNDNLMYEKNCIEFLVELGEFVNETKCFKYWSIKKPKYDEMLEELADVFTMLMYFYNILDYELKEFTDLKDDTKLLEIINDTYILGTKLYKDNNELLLDNIFRNLLIISKKLNIEENEIIKAIDKKHIIIEERLNSDY